MKEKKKGRPKDSVNKKNAEKLQQYFIKHKINVLTSSDSRFTKKNS